MTLTVTPEEFASLQTAAAYLQVCAEATASHINILWARYRDGIGKPPSQTLTRGDVANVLRVVNGIQVPAGEVLAKKGRKRGDQKR